MEQIAQKVKDKTVSNLIDIIHLKYTSFVQMVDELNSIAEYFLDENGYSLSFNVCKGTDLTFFWKLTVRVECSKSKVGQTDIKSYRILQLNQFINIYNHIKQQADSLKLLESPTSSSSICSETQTTEAATATATANVASCCMTQSKLFDSIQASALIAADECGDKDEGICCICMDARSNLILSCAHSYCESCIKQWQVSSHTCPICRCISSTNDGFVLADKPDYYHLQDEISKSLFQITDSSRTRRLSHSGGNGNQTTTPTNTNHSNNNTL